MKKIIFVIMFLLCLSMVSAVSYTQSSTGYVKENFQNCQVDNLNCTITREFYTVDYRDDSSIFKALTGGGSLFSIITEPILDNYRFYFEYTVFNATEYYGDDRVNSINISCHIDCNNFNCTNTDTLTANYSPNEEQERTYWEVTLRDGDFLSCFIDVYYKNSSVMLLAHPYNTRIWQPSYLTTTNEVDRTQILNLEAENEDLRGRITGQYATASDYVLEVIQAVVKINFKLWVYFYWAILIGVVVGIFSMFIYLIYWIYRHVKKL